MDEDKQAVEENASGQDAIIRHAGDNCVLRLCGQIWAIKIIF